MKEKKIAKEEKYTLKEEMWLKTDFFKQFFIALKYLSRPLKEGKRMRVIIDYDPKKSMTMFKYFNVEE